MTAPATRPSLGVKLAYGVGAIAYGVKNNGFDYFLLIFYSQVLGLDALLVGLAISLALVFDAVSDPIIGYLSDNTRSRFGRRHPYMYAAVIPVTLTYALLWNPPTGWSDGALFAYLLALSVVIRTCITLYEAPCAALIPEISPDYDQRTSILSFRYFFGWFGGATMSAFTLTVLLRPTDTVASGLMNPQGYALYGVIAAGVLAASMLICALGTHRLIPQLKTPPPRARKSLKQVFGEIFETLADRSFFALTGGALFTAMAIGATAGLTHYVNGFFWGFSTDEIGLISISVLLSATIALLAAPQISRRLGKKRGAMLCGLLALSFLSAPIFLRLLDLMPQNGDPALFVIIMTATVIGASLVISLHILIAAMFADLVEQSELRTERRSEGVFFAAMTFTQKSGQGLGLLATSAILTFARFPEGVSPGAAPTQAVHNLGAYYAPTLAALYLIAAAWLFFYMIDRKRHAENLRKLAGGGPS